MIVFRDRPLLIVTPPKCASGSLHEHFGRGDRTFWVCGPCDPADPSVYHHVAHVPTELMHDDAAMVVRDARDRMVSLFEHLNALRAEQNKPAWSFREYIELATSRRIGDWLYEWTNSDLIAPLRHRTATIGRPVFDHLIRFDYLAADLSALGLDPRNLPHVRRNMRRDWREHYDRGPLAMVEHWTKEDEFILGATCIR